MYLATGSSFKTLWYSSRMSDVTAGRFIHKTCKLISESLHNKHMPFPLEEQVVRIAAVFCKNWRFPNYVGSIDGMIFELNAHNILVLCSSTTINIFLSYCKQWQEPTTGSFVSTSEPMESRVIVVFGHSNLAKETRKWRP
jgi:hypothetical protein